MIDPRRTILLAATAASLLLAPRLNAEESGGRSESFTPPEEFQEFVTAIVREQLPDHYEKTRNWGQTTRIWAGWKLERDGLRLETRRRYRDVNDGPWQKYRIEVIHPEKHFHVTLSNIRQAENKILGDVSVEARLHAFGRHSQWERGVQLISVSADATARVRLQAQVELTTGIDAAKFPPDLLLSPRVTAANLEILDFRLDRVSDFDGPLVKSLSSTVREILEEKLAEKRHKLVEKMNKSLAKRRDKFRLSASEWIESPLASWFSGSSAAQTRLK